MASGRKSKAFVFFKKYHKWVSLVLSLFILIFAISGIILNHRSWLSGVDVNRKFLPAAYQYKNWNLAAVRGGLKLGKDIMLIYGNIGVWRSDDNQHTFSDFNQGFPEGIDNRKISKIVASPDGQLFAATFFGLYIRKGMGSSWEKLTLPVDEDRIVDLAVEDQRLFILTRSNLLIADLAEENVDPQIKVLPPPEDYDKKASLFRTLWIIHSGEIYGNIGKLFVDFMGFIFVFLTITGLLYFFFPKLIRYRRRRELQVKTLAKITRHSLKWHNRTGYWLVPMLILTTVTGMFLRPPLLIPIAGTKIAPVPFSNLDRENPWEDKLRGMMPDSESNTFILYTSDGFYYCDSEFETPLRLFPVQPPVSVMGLNVFERTGKHSYLIGSFSGLYTWFPRQHYVEDVISGMPLTVGVRSGLPISENAVAGFLKDVEGHLYLFDYVRGAEALFHNKSFPEMPVQIIEDSPMSLWNVALEFHTARIYSVFIGDFYILIIPLAGFSVLFILVSGFYLYWVAYRRKRPVKVKMNESPGILDESLEIPEPSNSF